MWEFCNVIESIPGHKPATQPPVIVQSLEKVQASASVTEDNQLPDAPTCSTSPNLFEETQVDADDSTSRLDTSVLKKRSRKWTKAEESTSTTELFHKFIKFRKRVIKERLSSKKRD